MRLKTDKKSMRFKNKGECVVEDCEEECVFQGSEGERVFED